MSLKESVTATASPSVWDALENLLSQFPRLEQVLIDMQAAASSSFGNINWMALVQIVGTAVMAGSGFQGIIIAILSNLAVILSHPAVTGTRSVAGVGASGEAVAAVSKAVAQHLQAF